MSSGWHEGMPQVNKVNKPQTLAEISFDQRNCSWLLFGVSWWKKNLLVEKKCACVTVESEAGSRSAWTIFLMNTCVCRVLPDHTKCGFVLFPRFENSCKWCGLEQTTRQSRADFLQEWFGAILLCSRVKGTCPGNYWRELGTVALKLRASEKKKNLILSV